MSDAGARQPWRGAIELAAAVRDGHISAARIARDTLDAIEKRNPSFNCFTAVTADRALREADSVDRALASGHDPGPLAGVPYAVKNLFDVAGMVTLAGSKINRDHPPAGSDATVVQRLAAAGAVLVGALNMDEYAYGFTTENTHYGPTRNPHDITRVAGGSSGGSAAAVAAGLVPLSLGSDTNGSIRVPAALCGVYGLKLTYGRLSRTGAAAFVDSIDHVGPFATTVADIAVAYDAMQGADLADPGCATRPAAFAGDEIERGIGGLRIAVAGDYFATGGMDEAHQVLADAARALGATQTVTLPEAARARAAAYVISASEGGNLHLADLKKRSDDFDPMTRDRLLAGALVPAAWYLQAQRFRRWFRDRVREIFREVDIILTPAAPCAAPLIGQETMMVGGVEMPTRANLGIFTQPISFIGLPVVAVPIRPPGALPLGVQVIAAPWREIDALRVARYLEQMGVANGRPVA
jgi:AtzE family amidohydrolase